MLHNNKFTKGLNKDLSRDLISPEIYYDAQNMTLITVDDQSTGAIQNIKGNLLAVTMPGTGYGTQDTSNVSELLITLDPSGVGGTINITIVTNPGAVSVTLFLIPYDTTSKKYFYDNVASAINTSLNSVGIYAASNADHVVVWSGLDITNALINTSITISITNNTSTGSIVVDNNYVPAHSSLEWIGWGRIRDVFYLLSTNETGNPSPTNSYGQIWRFEYDKVTSYYRLTLIYNNQINFTNFHPVANPGAFIGNYETDTIQKIYWTDNFNRLRILNTADPNVFALLPDEIDIYPNVSLSIPILQSVNEGGGVLARGVWQTAYRLKSTTGTVTAFSTPSNPVLLVDHLINGTMIDYICDPTNAGDSGKSLTYKISNVDNSYDRIEIVTLYRTELNQVPTIQMVVDESILGNSEFTYTVNGNQTPVDITIDEFLADPLIFDTVKSIAVKNNFMFAGNVKYSDFDVNFDTRAYRYDNTGATYIDPILNPNDVNPNQSPGVTGDPMLGRFLFQKNGTTFGGGDPFVSNVWYEFTTPRRDTANAGDYDIVLDLNYNGNGGQWTYPYFNITPGTLVYDANLDFDFEEYPNPNTYADYHSPHISSALKQYRRDETYRIGIVFFSKKGEPSYVHWVGDIRFPHVYMPTPRLGTVDRTPDNLLVPNNANWFPIAIVDNTTAIHYGNPLGLKLSVDVSSIADQISGFSVVRVKRENDDKTILGQGIMYPADFRPGGGTYTLTNSQAGNLEFPAGTVSPNVASFNCPDFLFKGSPSFKANDFFDYVSLLVPGISSGSVWGGDPISYQSDKFKINKFYIQQSPPTQLTIAALNNPTILGSAAVSSARSYDYLSNTGGGSIAMNSFFTGVAPGSSLYNASEQATGSGGGTPFPSLGSKTLLTNVTFAGLPYSLAVINDQVLRLNSDALNNQYLCNYKRNVVQYGGNSISQRSTNEYISTGHYQPVDVDHSGVPTSLTYIYTGAVFGGDNYITLFDNVKQFPRTKNGCTWDTSGGIDTIEVAHIYPVETDININLRRSNNGVYQVLNKFQPAYNIDGFGANLDNSIDVDEEFVLYDYIDIENDVKKFFPRPDPFIDRLKYDVRVFASQRKVNGELQDNWGIFKEADHIDVDSIQGPITNLITHKDKLIAYQDQGIVNLPVEERSLIQDTDGGDLSLGHGGVLPRYDYISKKLGSRHQFSFTQSPDAVFFFDMNSKNLYKQTDINPESISLIKGMSSYFKDNLTGLIQIEDNPFRNTGITAIYDFNDNEAVYTFKDKQKIVSNALPTTVQSYPGNNVFIVQFTGIPFLTIGGEVIYEYIDPNTSNIISLICIITALNATYPIPPIQATLQAEGIIELNAIPVAGTVYILQPRAFTIAYNDFVDAFTSFYSFHPCMYVSDQLNYFTPSVSQDDLWIHKKGKYGCFYQPVGQEVPNNSTVSFIVNPDYNRTKRFSNYTMLTESYNPNGDEQIQDTFNSVRIYNTNQNTDFQTLPIDNTPPPRGPKQIARRVENQWNLSYLFDRVLYTTPNPDIFTDLSAVDIPFAQRLRSKFLTVDLIYNNTIDPILGTNNRLILRSFSTEFDYSPR